MFVNEVRNVNFALAGGLSTLLQHGVEQSSRNGPVIVAPAPVTTVTHRPDERVLSLPGRNENPFFHFVESLWMLAGRNDLAALTPYVSRMAQFSDDGGKTQPGAYGHRWRRHFDRDQLAWAIQRLRKDPNDRRVVIGMWDPRADIDAADAGGRDVPCNTHVYLGVTRGQVNMTICCRSNDAIWGAHGANAVHFSVLLEYIARSLGRDVGFMYQFSNNYHAYTEVMAGMSIPDRPEEVERHCMYKLGLAKPFPIMDEMPHAQVKWDEDLAVFWKEPTWPRMHHRFFKEVARPIVMAHRHYRDTRGEDRYTGALEIVQECQASDWRIACSRWIEGRHRAWVKAQDDGVDYGRGEDSGNAHA